LLNYNLKNLEISTAHSNDSLIKANKNMTGDELQQILLTKWGHSYDVQIRRVQRKMLLQVMWKYLEQASFPMTETEYLEHLDTVASYISAWGGDLQVQSFIEQTRDRPRLGKAVNIPIDLGARASEWLLEEL
jgi:Domain of unknown function (DUF3067)